MVPLRTMAPDTQIYDTIVATTFLTTMSLNTLANPADPSLPLNDNPKMLYQVVLLDIDNWGFDELSTFMTTKHRYMHSCLAPPCTPP